MRKPLDTKTDPVNPGLIRRLLLEIFPGPLMAPAVRLCEAYLIAVCLVYGTIILLAPAYQFTNIVILDDWHKTGRLLCIPLFIKSGFGIAGLALNNWRLRAAEGFTGSVIWFWLTTKYISVGIITPSGFSFTFASIYISIYIMISAFMARPTQSG